MAEERKKAEEATKRAKNREEAKLAKEAGGKPVANAARAKVGGTPDKGKGGKAPKGKKRAANDDLDYLEPEEKKAKPADDAEWEAPVMEVQSKLVTGATLRDYQLAGAQWLGTSHLPLHHARAG